MATANLTSVKKVHVVIAERCEASRPHISRHNLEVPDRAATRLVRNDL